VTDGSGPNADKILIVGGYSEKGAYGPTILLQLESPAAATWLRDIFVEVSKASLTVDLVADPRVRLSGVKQLLLEADPGVGSLVQLRRTQRAPNAVSFRWIGTSTGWGYQADLMEPLTKGRAGHQYLTTEERDDALIEVSLGERHTGLDRVQDQSPLRQDPRVQEGEFQ
jgi:hypothetical protein